MNWNFNIPSYIRFGTGTHTVKLVKDSTPYWGVYNGFTYWGRIFGLQNGEVIEVSSLQTEVEIDEEYGESYLPNFTLADFEKNGYEVVETSY